MRGRDESLSAERARRAAYVLGCVRASTELEFLAPTELTATHFHPAIDPRCPTGRELAKLAGNLLPIAALIDPRGT